MRLLAEENTSENPLSSQASTVEQFEKDKLTEKNKDLQWCSQKINFKKHRWSSTSVSVKGERVTKKKPAKVTITIERSNLHIVSHLVHRLDIYGYYEWLEIKKASGLSDRP